MTRIRLLFFALVFLASTELLAEAMVVYELDPYYTNVGLYVPLTDEPMREVVLKNEARIYLELLANAFTPRFFIVEASVNPLPVLGTYLKDRQRGTYDRAEVSPDLNLIQALTEGFEEPYALSLFVGNVVGFKSSREIENSATNKGFSGFLFSIGDKHIKDADLINDDWYEIEWKLKGDRRLNHVYHSWSFRVGIKIHENPDISDVNYFGFRRELFDGKIVDYDWSDNIGIDYKISFSRKTSDVVQQQIFVEKKWPLESGLYSLGIGLNRNSNKYFGALADDNNDLNLIIRPGFQF